MPQPSPSDKIPLTLQLTPEIAARLKQAADARNRQPADLVIELLNIHLPRQSPGVKPGNIPYA